MGSCEEEDEEEIFPICSQGQVECQHFSFFFCGGKPALFLSPFPSFAHLTGLARSFSLDSWPPPPWAISIASAPKKIPSIYSGSSFESFLWSFRKTPLDFAITSFPVRMMPPAPLGGCPSNRSLQEGTICRMAKAMFTTG